LGDRDYCPSVRVAIVHDYLTQRGGAERVVVAMVKAFPDAPVYTSLYEADGTFDDFRRVEVRRSFLDRIGPLRRRHRLALPLLAPAFSRLRVEADVALCSSSGWAHGAAVSGRKVVYCHTPARWLYQTDRYLGERGGVGRLAVELLGGPLRRWDRRAARTADRYLANSTVVHQRIRALYGIDAEVLPPPPALDPEGRSRPVEGVEPGFFLCVSRLLPYKNVGAMIAAFADLPSERLVVVGAGPEGDTLRRAASANIHFAGRVEDDELRWLYANCIAVVAASYEDFGLTPLEAAAFGKPSVALRWGGFLDTVVDGVTGVFFGQPKPEAIGAAVRACLRENWSVESLERHAEAFSEGRFMNRLREIVARVAENGR
jgi:glycosyltransferase involved in cell wall biosynthesis